MAGLALGAAGAYLAPAGYASMGWLIGSTIGNLLFPQKQPDVRNEGARLSDLELQSSDYGRCLPTIFGTMPVGGNLVLAKPLQEVIETTTEEQGGKGGPSQTVTTVNYRYFAHVVLAMTDCRDGPIAGIPRLWINGELVYDKRPGASVATTINSAELESIMRIYLGTADQAVDPLTTAILGTKAHAFRHTSLIVFDGLEVTKWGTFPQVKAEIVGTGTQGALETYYDGTATTSDGNVVTAYVADRGELWYTDTEYGSGTAQDRIAILDTATGTYSYILLESPRHALSNANNGILMHLAPKLDRAYIQGKGSPEYTTLEYSISTRQYIRALIDVHPDSVYDSILLGVDEEHNTALAYFQGTAHSDIAILDLGSFAALARLTHSGPGSGIEAFPDADGNFWFPYDSGSAFKKMPLIGAITSVAFGADGCDAGKLARDPSRNCLYYWSVLGTGSEHLKKLDFATGTVSRLNAVAYASPIHRGEMVYAADIDRIIVHQTSPYRFLKINPTDGSVESSHAVAASGDLFNGTQLAYAPGVIWGGADTWTGSAKGIGEYRFDTLVDAGTTHAVAMTAICESVGLTTADIDVSQLTSLPLAGYALTRVMTAREAAQILMLAGQYDAVESQGKIKFVVRGGAVAAVIERGDLITHMDGEDWKAPVDVTSRLETEGPIEVRVTAADYTLDYADNVQYARRQVGESDEVQNITLPMRLTPTETKKLATMLLYGQAVASQGLEFSTTNRWLHLEPTDNVQVPDGNRLYTGRMESKGESRSRINWRAPVEDITIYSQNGAGAASGPLPVGLVSPIGNTFLQLLDIPILRPQDDNIGIYIAVTGAFDGWRGCEIWKSSDGINYQSTGLKINAATPQGYATTALQDYTNGNTLDLQSWVDVSLIPGSGELSSATLQEFFDGFRACVIGGEVMLFRDAELIASDTYRLSAFLRGRSGTEAAISTHGAGERFTLLTAASLRRLELTAGDVGKTLYFKPVTVGSTTPRTAPFLLAFQNIGKKPLKPIDVAAIKLDSGDWAIDWERQSRLAAGWNNFVDTPTDGTVFDLEVFNSTFTTLKRTVSGITVLTHTYTVAEQTTDFGSGQTTLYLRLHPASAEYGRGDYVQGTFTS